MDELENLEYAQTEELSITSELKKFSVGMESDHQEDDPSLSDGIGYEDLAALYDVSQAVNSTLILDDILDIVMTRSIKLLKAERGFLMLLDDRGKLQFKTGHNVRMEQLRSDDMKISTTIANMVVQSGQAVYTSDAQVDDRFYQKASIIDLNIRSAMCVPLKIKEKIIGILYLDNSSQANIFLRQDLVLFEMFADQAALAIHNARLYTEVLELQIHQQNIFTHTPVGILVVDINQKVTSYNVAADRLFVKLNWTAYPPDENGMIGLEITGIIPENYAQTFTDSIKNAGTKPIEISRFNVEYANDEAILKIKFCPYEIGKGEPAGHIILIEDITEQVILEQYLILSEKLIAKGEMAAAIGHELNNYLTAISSNAQLLSMTLAQDKVEKLEEKVKVILKNVDHIKRFSDGLMDFSTLESKLVPFDLSRLVEDIVFFVHPQKAFKKVAFDINIPVDLPQVLIDIGQIHQVFLNILINAADIFAEFKGGKGKISISAEPYHGGKSIKAIIADDGPGIAQEVLTRMFEPHVTSKKTGHGFGLWTCLKIIESHNGSIKAKNRSEGGARFEIVLPVAVDQK